MLLVPKPPKPVAPAPVEVNTLAEAIERLHGAPYKLAAEWELNYRTYTKRVSAPETMTVTEFQALAEILRVEPVALLAVISSQVKHALPAQVTVPKATTLAELVAASSESKLKLGEVLGGADYRTAAKRVKNPDTLQLGELFALATVLKADPAALLRIVYHELRVSPPPVRPKRGRAKGAALSAQPMPPAKPAE
jgi:hypothetical protein